LILLSLALFVLFSLPITPAGASRAESPLRPQLAEQSAGVITSVRLKTITTGLNDPRGIDHHQPTGNVAVSMRRSPTQPLSYELITAGGARAGSFSGFSEGGKIAAVRDKLGGFAPGEVFVGTDIDGGIARISSDGSSVESPWVTLPAETGAVDAGLCVDSTGVFKGDLIVVTSHAAVWRIDSSGTSTLLARFKTTLRGVVTVPDDSAKYGAWAGRVLVGAPQQGGVYTIDAKGNTEFYQLGVFP